MNGRMRGGSCPTAVPRRRGRRRGPVLRRESAVFRAVTLGPGHDDWAVVDGTGQILYRGYAVYAARMASELAAAAR